MRHPIALKRLRRTSPSSQGRRLYKARYINHQARSLFGGAPKVGRSSKKYSFSTYIADRAAAAIIGHPKRTYRRRALSLGNISASSLPPPKMASLCDHSTIVRHTILDHPRGRSTAQRLRPRKKDHTSALRTRRRRPPFHARRHQGLV
jgi:hypothetical protein